MKTHTAWLLISALALGGAAALAADTDSPSGKSAATGSRGGRGCQCPCDRAPSAAMAAWEKSALALYDTNGNGKLDADERAVLRDDVKAGKYEAPPMPPRGAPGRGFGAHKPPPEVLAKYDLDGDGVLNDAERAKLHADIKSGALKPPAPPVGGPRHGKGKRPPPPPPPPADEASAVAE